MSSDGRPSETPSCDPEVDAALTPKKPPPSEVHFAFGPQNWYWARCGARWRFVRSNSSDWDNLKIYDAYWVAFKHDTGFLIGGEDNDGGGRVVHSWNDGHMVRADNVDSFVKTRDAYIKLHDWISEQVVCDPDKVRNISITIGPKGSYFARLEASHITHALPKGLRDAMEKSDTLPESVALGMKGAWVAIWADGSSSWDLRNAYPSLVSAGHLNSDSKQVVFTALNPYAEDQYFVVSKDGGCSYKVSFSDKEEGKTVHEMTDTYMRARAKRDGTTFSHPMTLNGVSKQVRITPSSNSQETAADALVATLRGRLRSEDGLHQKDVAFVGAVTAGAGALAKLAGLPTLRSAGIATSTGVGAALALWFRG